MGKEANSKINVKKSLLINLSIINSPQKYAQSVEKIFSVPVNVNPELIMMEGNPVLGKERMSPKVLMAIQESFLCSHLGIPIAPAVPQPGS